MIPSIARPLMESSLCTWDPSKHPSLLLELYVDWLSSISAFEEEIDDRDEHKEHDEARAGGSTTSQCLGLVLEQVGVLGRCFIS